METKHRIIIGDARCMEQIQNHSVHLIVTSPPYWQLKDYGSEKQIGFNDSYESYINNLNLVWNECNRVLHPGCRLCINIGDQFARSVYYGRYKIIPIRTEIIRFCETIGLDYMGAIIWQKVTTCNTTGGATIMGSFPYPRNGIVKIDYEFILLFKKPGKAPAVSKKIKERSAMSKEEWNLYFAGHWNFPGESQSNHLAMFPEELPRRLIKMFSFVGDTVLDPFMGSGTTCLAARNLERHSVGYEVNESFLPVIRDKLGVDENLMFCSDSFSISHAPSRQNYEEHIAKLPYQFHDPVHFDKKADPRKLQFGSKIDKNSKKREEYFNVKKIISPTTLLLSNDIKIKLLGIREKRGKQNAAMRYLEETTRGTRVFMKFDEEKYDQDDVLLCYLYLQNKTFLNSHLIKRGIAEVDTTADFKYKAKFLRERNSV